MKVLVDLPSDDIERLSDLCKKDHVPRTEVIRRAVRHFLKQMLSKPKREDYFGLWKARKLDGRKYEDKIRAEW